MKLRGIEMTTDTQDLLQRAFAGGHLQLITSGKTEKIRFRRGECVREM